MSVSSGGQGTHTVAQDTSGFLSAADQQNISSILAALGWNGTDITYSFPTASSQYGTTATYADPAPFNSFSQLDSAGHSGQVAEVMRAFALVSSYTNLTFTQITETDTTHASIRLANSGTPPTSYTTNLANSDGGDVFYGATGHNPVMGNFDSGQTTLHEIGHALGLKHGQDNTNYGVMNADRLDIEFSLMNYPNYIGSTEGFATASTSPQSYMMYDIAALQYMYGANFGQVGHNAVYTWSATAGTEFVNGVSQGNPVDNHIFETIWTAGANSTYDLSNFAQNQVDDMRPGGWMDFSTTQLADLNAFAPSKPSGEIFARGDIYNALEYNGNSSSLIDNIITGVGNDSITGNAANNTVDGGGGTNTFVETGNHTDHSYTYLSNGYIQIQDLRAGSPDGSDLVKDIQLVQFNDGTFNPVGLLPKPTITGTVANQAVNDNATTDPFALVAISDPNVGQTETVTVTPTLTANGTLSDPNAATDGSTITNGVYKVTGTAAQVTTDLDALIFHPTVHQVAPGNTVTTGFTIAVTNSPLGLTATDSATSVIATAIAVPPTITGTVANQHVLISIAPFKTVVIGDLNFGQTDTVTITQSTPWPIGLNGTLRDPNAHDGSHYVNGVYTVTGTAAQVTADVEGLSWSNGLGTTHFTINVTDTAHQTATDHTVSVIGVSPSSFV